MISTHTDIVAELAKEGFRFAWLVEIPGPIPATPLYFTDFQTDIEFGGNSYKSTGDLLSLPTLTRERAIKSHSVSIELSANDGLLNSSLGARNLTGEPCTLKLVFLDQGGGIIGNTALTLYAGTFDGWSYREGSDGDTINIRITGPWAKPNLTAGRFTSDSNQLERYAGDAFFKFAHEKKDNLGWGGEK